MDYKALVHTYWREFQKVRFHVRLTTDHHGSAESLVLPKIFTENRDLAVSSTLSSNKDSSWPVKLKADRAGNVLITDGWKEFVNAHCLKKNDILIFKYYVGQFRFKVSIFDGQTDGQNPTSFYVRPKSSETDNKDHLDSEDGDSDEKACDDHKREPDPRAVPGKRGHGCRQKAKEPDDDSDSDDNNQQSARKKACDGNRSPVRRDSKTMKERTLKRANEMKRMVKLWYICLLHVLISQDLVVCLVQGCGLGTILDSIGSKKWNCTAKENTGVSTSTWLQMEKGLNCAEGIGRIS